MSGFKDITGQTINGWKAVRYLGGELWLVLCPQCGKELQKRSSDLRSLKKGHCKECQLKNGNLSRTHGHTVNGKPTKVWICWHSLFSRCYNANHKAYKDYGGRGITVCERWHKFENFLEDMGVLPEGLTLDRINNDGNYEPGNCRWATRKEQGNNRSTNKFAFVNGERLTLSQASEKLNCNYSSLLRVVHKAKIPDGVVPTLKRKSGNYKSRIWVWW